MTPAPPHPRLDRPQPQERLPHPSDIAKDAPAEPRIVARPEAALVTLARARRIGLLQ
jgi:hypothetical protein